MDEYSFMGEHSQVTDFSKYRLFVVADQTGMTAKLNKFSWERLALTIPRGK